MKTQVPFVHNASDCLVTGVIKSRGKYHTVRVPVTLLVQDAALWLGRVAANYFEAADSADARYRFDSAADYRVIGDAVVRAGAGLSKRTGVPLVDARLALRPLVIGHRTCSSWRRALVSAGEHSSDAPKFMLSDGVLEVSSELSWLSDFVTCAKFGLYKQEHETTQARS